MSRDTRGVAAGTGAETVRLVRRRFLPEEEDELELDLHLECVRFTSGAMWVGPSSERCV